MGVKIQIVVRSVLYSGAKCESNKPLQSLVSSAGDMQGLVVFCYKLLCVLLFIAQAHVSAHAGRVWTWHTGFDRLRVLAMFQAFDHLVKLLTEVFTESGSHTAHVTA